jgi:hypothetical protein
MSDRYATMDKKELLFEASCWLQVIDAPKGPGSPSVAARAAAEAQLALVDAWIERRKAGF